MPPIQGYGATVEAARRALETAQNALARDVGQAVVNADWDFLRDKFDVGALVDHVSELAAKPDFVASCMRPLTRPAISSPTVAGRRSRAAPRAS